MKQSTFDLLNYINTNGFDNSQWGLLEDIASTEEYFGSKEDYVLNGKWLYIWHDNEEWLVENATKVITTEYNDNIALFKL